MKKMTKLNDSGIKLTKLEKEVIQTGINQGSFYWENGIGEEDNEKGNVTLGAMFFGWNIPEDFGPAGAKRARGAVSSLVKKGVITVSESEKRPKSEGGDLYGYEINYLLSFDKTGEVVIFAEEEKPAPKKKAPAKKAPAKKTKAGKKVVVVAEEETIPLDDEIETTEDYYNAGFKLAKEIKEAAEAEKSEKQLAAIERIKKHVMENDVVEGRELVSFTVLPIEGQAKSWEVTSIVSSNENHPQQKRVIQIGRNGGPNSFWINPKNHAVQLHGWKNVLDWSLN